MDSDAPSSPDKPPIEPDLSAMHPGHLEEYFLTYEHAPERSRMDAWLRAHNMEIFRDSEGAVTIGYGLGETVLPDSNSIRALTKRDVALSDEVTAALYRPEDVEAYGRCVAAWRARGGTVENSTRWVGIDVVEARNGVGRLTIEIPEAYWPDGLDQEFRRCVLAHRDGRTWKASRDYSFRFESGGYIPKEEGGACVAE